MTRIDPIDQANLIAGHAVSYAAAFLDGRHTAVQLGNNADRLFLDLLVVEAPETSSFLIPVQLLAITMMRIAKHERELDGSSPPVSRWEQVLASLVDLVCHESRQIKKD
jgi:hypothetical protein